MGKRFVEKNVPEKKWKLHRAVGILLAVAVTCQTMPFDGITVFAAEEVQSAEAAACTHEHTEDCYKVIEDCIHEHEESCYPEATTSEEGENSTEEENKQPTECMHSCSEESGCITKELDCHHEHDASCGYTQETSSEEETTESPSTFVGEIYNGETTEDTAVSSENTETITETEIEIETEDEEVVKEAENLCLIEDLIAALPDKVMQDNEDEVRAQLDEILALFAELTEEQQEQIDLSHCLELQRELDETNDIEPVYNSSGLQDVDKLYVLGHEVVNGDVKSGIGWSFADNRLTLDNLNIQAGDYPEGTTAFLQRNGSGSAKRQLEIYLKGDNTINGAAAGEKLLYTTSTAIKITGETGSTITLNGFLQNEFEISGDITVTINTESSLFWDYGITIDNGAKLVINSNHSKSNYSVFVSPRGEVSIKNGSTLEINTQNDTMNTKRYYSLYGYGPLIVENSTLTIRNSHPNGQAVWMTNPWGDSVAQDTAVITGSTVNLDARRGILSYTTKVENSTITTSENTGFALMSEFGETTVTNSTVDGLVVSHFSDDSHPTEFIAYGRANLPMDLTLAEGDDITIPKGGSLNIHEGVTLTNDGIVHIYDASSLPGKGMLTGTGSFLSDAVTEDMINIPQPLYYTGKSLKAQIVLQNTLTAMGQSFTADIEGWTMTEPDEIVEAGDYTVVFQKGEEKISKDFTVSPSGTKFDGGVKTYNGETEASQFTASDTITVKVIPTATGEAPQKEARLYSAAAPSAGQMALFVGKKQVSNPVSADVDGSYTMTVSASDVLVLGEKEPNGDAITLIALFVENDNMADASGTVEVNISAVAKVEKGGVAAYVSAENFSSVFAADNGNDSTAITLLTDVALGETLELTSGSFTLDLNGRTIDFGSEHYLSVSCDLAIRDSGDGGTISGKYGIYVPENSTGTVALSGGRYTGTTTAVTAIGDSGMYNPDKVLIDLLDKSENGDGTYYAFYGGFDFGEEASPIPVKGFSSLLGYFSTVTVQECTHEDVCEYDHDAGSTTHEMFCNACEKQWVKEICSYTNGRCNCGSTLAVTLPDNLDLTYNGTAQEPVVTVMLDRTKLDAVNYDVNYTDNINAGTDMAKVTVTGKSPYTFTEKRTFSIEKAPLTIKANSQTITYGENVTQEIGQVTSTGLCASDTLKSITLTASSDQVAVANKTIMPSNAQIQNSSSEDVRNNYNITYEAGPLTINKAKGELTLSETLIYKEFGSPSFVLDVRPNHTESQMQYKVVNGTDVASVSDDGSVTIKNAGEAVIEVSLPASANYNAAQAVRITINVTKKGGFTPESVNRRYLYSRENTGTVDLAVLLPDDCGEIIYHTPSTSGALTYKTEPAVTKEGILSYTLNSGSKEDEGTITVTVATRNYEDITITVKIKLTDKIPVNLKDGTKVTLKNDVLTYGEPLSKLLFNEAEFIGEDGENVEGTLAWEDQTAKPDAGTPSAVWVFTPEDDIYSVLEDAVSIKVNKAAPQIITAPTALKRIYSPAKPLEKADLTGGEVVGVDGRALSGTWDWHRDDIIPDGGVNSYHAVFMPENAANYERAEAAVTVDVEKAVPYLDLKQLPSASAITYGDSLAMSELTGGSAQYGDGMGNPGTGTDSKITVAGIFTWKEQNVKPAVADSNQTEYAVIFTPEDAKNYNTAETVMTLIVNKAQDAPNMPLMEMNVSNSIEKVSDVPLPEGWAWQDSDRDTALEPDTAVTAEAVYIGADQGNYINESVTVAITRSSCEHTAGEILYTGSGEKLPTCTEAGLGHRECTKCHAVIESGITLPATGHDYNEGEVTKEPTEASEGEKTYTCSRCGGIYTESIPKKIPKGLWIDNLEPSIPYTGSAIKQEAIRVYYGDTLLREKTDYTISYKNNTNAGTAQIIVTGKGNYTGKAVKDFMIEPVDISRDSNLSAMVTTAVETGKKLKPAVAVTWNGKPLKEKKDYTLSYDTNIKTAGDYDITVTGNKNYTGVLVRTFHVKQRGTKLLNSAKVTGIKKSYPYTSAYQGSALESDLKNMIVKMGKTTLTRDIDYTVCTENTTVAGTAVIILEASATSPYAGEKRITTAITGTDLRKGSIKINSAEKAFSYTGAPVTPQITVYSGKNGSGSIVPAGAYTVSYSSNIDKGRATVTATGIPEKGCSGSVQCTFQIGTLNLETERAAGNIKVTMPTDISHAKGGAVPQPVITHTYHQTTRTLREGADYTLKYSGNMTAGGAKTPTVKITGIGNYSGSITETYVISAQGISSLSVTVTDRAYRKNKKGSYYYSAPKVYDLDGKQLKSGKDYTVAYTYADSGKPIGKNDKIPAGTKLCATVTAAKNSSYTGTQSATYFVREAKAVRNIAKAKIDKIAPQQYTGSAVTPEIRLYEKTGKTKNYLTSKDYEIIGYYNNTKRGTASILVRGKGAYSGVKRITFKIVQKKIK